MTKDDIIKKISTRLLTGWYDKYKNSSSGIHVNRLEEGVMYNFVYSKQEVQTELTRRKNDKRRIA